MTFKTGLIIGAAVGYYYGAKAGRQRFEQIDQVLEPIRESDIYRDVSSRLRDALGYSVRETVNRAKEAAFGPDQRVVPLRRDTAS